MRLPPLPADQWDDAVQQALPACCPRSGETHGTPAMSCRRWSAIPS